MVASGLLAARDWLLLRSRSSIYGNYVLQSRRSPFFDWFFRNINGLAHEMWHFYAIMGMFWSVDVVVARQATVAWGFSIYVRLCCVPREEREDLASTTQLGSTHVLSNPAPSPQLTAYLKASLMLPRPHAITRDILHTNVFKWVPEDIAPVPSGGAESASTSTEAAGHADTGTSNPDSNYRKPFYRCRQYTSYRQWQLSHAARRDEEDYRSSNGFDMPCQRVASALTVPMVIILLAKQQQYEFWGGRFDDSIFLPMLAAIMWSTLVGVSRMYLGLLTPIGMGVTMMVGAMNVSLSLAVASYVDHYLDEAWAV